MATEHLKKIVEDVHHCRIVLPEFQRNFVWAPAAAIKLLTSLFNGYPIGSLLLMENNAMYEYRPIDGVQQTVAVQAHETELVLDGQKRITACYRAFYGSLVSQRSPGRYYFNYAEYVKRVKEDEPVDGSVLEDLFIFLKPQRVNRDFSNTAAEAAAGYLPMDVVFGEPRGSNYADWLSRYNFALAKGSSSEHDMLSKISSRFQKDYIEKVTGYQVNFERITRDTKPDVICTVFETINTTGIKLTVFDLLVAKCFKSNIRLRDQLEEAVSRYENIRFFDATGVDIASIHLPRIVGLLHNNQCRKGDLLQLPVTAISAHWDKAVAALDKILGIFRTQFGCVRADFIPSIDIITPLAVIVSDLSFSPDVHMKKLSRLYWNLVFSSYLSGAPETKSSRIVREWRQEGGYRDTETALPEAIRTFGFTYDDLDEATKNSTVYRGVLTLLVAMGARNFAPNSERLREISNTEFEDHHIFPQQFLRSVGIKGTLANSILNRTPITAEVNRKIGANSPSRYVKEVWPGSSADEVQTILSTHAIEADHLHQDFTPALFTAFRTTRRDRIIQLIEAATGQEIVRSATND